MRPSTSQGGIADGMRRRGPRVGRRLSVLLASGVVGLFLMLAIPGMATADPAVAEPGVAATPTSEATPVDTTPVAEEETPPAAEQSAEIAALLSADGWRAIRLNAVTLPKPSVRATSVAVRVVEVRHISWCRVLGAAERSSR